MSEWTAFPRFRITLAGRRSRPAHGVSLPLLEQDMADLRVCIASDQVTGIDSEGGVGDVSAGLSLALAGQIDIRILCPARARAAHLCSGRALHHLLVPCGQQPV